VEFGGVVVEVEFDGGVEVEFDGGVEVEFDDGVEVEFDVVVVGVEVWVCEDELGVSSVVSLL